MRDIQGKRREKQPLEYPSAGSTFKRPPGYFAGALIDEAGLKGFTVGGAQVSEKHAGFVINKGCYGGRRPESDEGRKRQNIRRSRRSFGTGNKNNR